MFKRLVLIVFVMACFATSAFAAERNKSFSPDKVTFNFGNIDELGGMVKHTFVYTNRSNKSLAIANATAHCGCVKVSYPKQPIRPGAKANIGVTYDPKAARVCFQSQYKYVSPTAAMQLYAASRAR